MSINDFADMFAFTVYHSEFAGRDVYGAPSYGSPAAYSARIIDKPVKVSTPDGQEAVAKGTIWIKGTPTITVQDQIEMPDGTTPRILLTEKVSDDTGYHHTKVYFGT